MINNVSLYITSPFLQWDSCSSYLLCSFTTCPYRVVLSDCCFWRWFLILAFDFQLLIINLILIIDIVVFIVRYLNRRFFRFGRLQSVLISPVYLAILCLDDLTARFCTFICDYSLLPFFVLMNLNILSFFWLLVTFCILIIVEGLFWLLLNFSILYVIIINWFYFQLFLIDW